MSDIDKAAAEYKDALAAALAACKAESDARAAVLLPERAAVHANRLCNRAQCVLLEVATGKTYDEARAEVGS